MKDIYNKLNKIDAQVAKDSLIRIIKNYMQPSFGAMPKRDIDLMLFSELYKLGVFPKQSKTELFDVISNLKITRQKARNLIYESQLRTIQEGGLRDELCNMLSNPIAEKTDQIILEVDNPFMMDYLKAKMKELHCLTDGSFNQDIVKMSVESFSKLLQDTFEIKSDAETKNRMHSLGLRDGKKDIFVDVIRHSVEQYLGPAFSDRVEEKVENAFDWINKCLERKKS